MKEMFSSVMARRMALTVVGMAGVAMLSSCQGAGDQPVDRSGMLSANDQVSTVPWNKPQGWENKSQLGALANDPRIGGQQ